MIVTVTANPALDVTYTCPPVTPGEVHRVTSVTERPGGKGINVARVLRSLGEDVVATGLTGGTTGRALVHDLEAAGVRTEFVDGLDDVRRTLVVHGEDGVTTSFWEPGRRLRDPAAAAEALVRRVESLLPEARALVVSGSLPPGLDVGVPARLASSAAGAGVPVLVDTDGEPLRQAASGGCAVLMPNREELARLCGSWPASVDDVVDATIRLCDQGVPAVVATLGSEGMLAATADGAWWARPVERISGNPTGAGDAAAAAVAARLALGGSPKQGGSTDWTSVLADAVALSASAVLRPVAGEVDLRSYERWRTTVAVEALPRGKAGGAARRRRGENAEGS